MQELSQEILTYLKERRWDNIRPSDIAKSISIEAAELLEPFQWSSLTIEETQAKPELMDQVRNELADVLIYCLEMAVLLDIDAERAVRDKLEKVKQKYPAELMRARETDEHGGGSTYWDIKKAHRKGGD